MLAESCLCKGGLHCGLEKSWSMVKGMVKRLAQLKLMDLMPHFRLRNASFSPDKKDALCTFNNLATCINRICMDLSNIHNSGKEKRIPRAKLSFLGVLVLTLVDIEILKQIETLDTWEQ